jgi:hypothetical protein
VRALSLLPYVAVGLALGVAGASLAIWIGVVVGLLFSELLIRRVVARKRRAAVEAEVPAAATNVAARQQIRTLATRDMTLGVGHGRVEDEVLRWLEPDEAVLALTICTHAGRWWQELRTTKSGRVLIATDRRLVLVPTGLLTADRPAARARFPEPETILYGDIEAVETETGRFESSLTLHTTAGVVRLTSMRAANAEAVKAAARPRAAHRDTAAD